MASFVFSRRGLITNSFLNCEIILDKTTFTAGEKIIGKVVFNPNENFNCYRAIASFFGVINVKFNETCNTCTSFLIPGKNQHIVFIGNKNVNEVPTASTIWSGRHEYPIAFTIPDYYPATYDEGSFGKIFYMIMIFVQHTHFQTMAKKELVILSHKNLYWEYLNDKIAKPFDERYYICPTLPYFYARGYKIPISIKIRQPRKAFSSKPLLQLLFKCRQDSFLPGEKISFSIELKFDNCDSRHLEEIKKCYLVKVVILCEMLFHDNYDMKKKISKTIKCCKKTMTCSATPEICNSSLILPEELLSSFNTRGINRTYFIGTEVYEDETKKSPLMKGYRVIIIGTIRDHNLLPNDGIQMFLDEHQSTNLARAEDESEEQQLKRVMSVLSLSSVASTELPRYSQLSSRSSSVESLPAYEAAMQQCLQANFGC